jgi:tetratricopeptide (TPR) repeat protein/tRNA A-37 threonylcarbamoyl transferase component Bud32
MSRKQTHESYAVSPALLFEINRICDRFELAWWAGGRPIIEDHLGAVAADARSELLRELLAIELERRQGAGEHPSVSEYHRRFPGDITVVDAAFARAALAAGDPTLEASPAETDRTVTVDAAAFPKGAEALSSAARPSVTGRRFQVLRPHDKGGLGEVFVALDTELNREVALKQIQDRHADDLANRTRFLLEAEVTGRLEHPGIVPVYGLGTYADGRPYYAMRFIRGDSLKDAIAAFHADPALKTNPGARALELGKLLRRFLDVCNAIDYAHSRGVLHRDIKPGNVIVGKYGETLVVDWGLAKPLGRGEPDSRLDETTLRPMSASGSAQTLPGAVLGTPAYMSPEQASGDIDQLGPRSDVYSLGTTLYCLLTGRAPFEGGDLEVLLRQVAQGAFPLPRRIAPTIDRALEAICLKAMARKPSNRYATPRELADDVERWIADEPVSAWREPLVRRVRRWARRHRTTITAAAAALVVALAASSALAALQSLAAQRERALAAREREAKAMAQARLGQVEKANYLLAAIFQDLDPRAEEKEGKPLRAILSGRVSQAAASLDAKAIADPLTEAKLQRVLGISQTNLGNTAEAVTLLTRASRTFETLLSRDDPETLSSTLSLATAFFAAGNKDEAIKTYEGMLKRAEVRLGSDHSITLTCRSNLATAYITDGQGAKAIPILEAMLKRLEVKGEPYRLYALLYRVHLAEAYLLVGRKDEAITLYEATVKAYDGKFDPAHPDWVSCRNSLALAYMGVGRTREAIAIFEVNLKEFESKVGHAHANTMAARDVLAMAYQTAGRAREAIPLLEANLKSQEWTLGADHSSTQLTRSLLARAYSSTGRAAEAIPLLEANLGAREAMRRPDHPDSIATRAALSEAYAAVGRGSEAIPLLETDLKALEAKVGKPHAQTLGCRSRLAVALLAAGRAAEAIPLIETNLEVHASQEGLDHANTVGCRGLLAEAYISAGRPDKAVALHEATLKRLEQKLGPDHLDTHLCRGQLAEADLMAGRPQEAIKLRAVILQRLEATFGPDHPDTVASRVALVETDVLAGRPEAAVQLIEATLRRYEATFGPDDPATLETRSVLAETYDQTGRHQESIRMSTAALARSEAALGQSHPATVRCRMDLAASYLAAGAKTEAIKRYEATLAQLVTLVGHDDPTTLACRTDLARAYEAAGQFSKLEPQARKVLERCRAEFGPTGPQTVDALASLGYCLVRVEKWPEAETVLRECVTIRETSEPGMWTTFDARSSLGAALLGQARYAAAEPLLVSGYTGLKTRENVMLPSVRTSRLAEAGSRVLRLYQAWGKPAKVDEWTLKLGRAELPDDVFVRP